MAKTYLRLALELFRNGEGWMKGDIHDSVLNRYCAFGALDAVVGSNNLVDNHPDLVALAGVMQEQFPDRRRALTYSQGSQVASVNDHLATTFEDIERCFEKAALRREEEDDG